MLFGKKKKSKSKPQPKTLPPKSYKPVEPPPKWKPTYNKEAAKDERKIPKEKPIKETLKTDWEKEFLNLFNKMTYRHRAWDVWRDLIIMVACTLSNAFDKTHFDEREKRYLKIIKGYSKEEQSMFPELMSYIVMALDENQEQDFLGNLFMRLNLGNGETGQIFTPYHVCQLMADVAVGDITDEINDKGYASISDPCCGAGATLIAAIHSIRKQLEKVNPPLNYQNHVLIVAQDIDEIVALMCYIQLSLLGVAGYVKVGNSLTEPIDNEDMFENYWFTPIYFSNVWVYRRLFHNL